MSAFRRMKILLVEDDPLDRLLTLRAFKGLNLDCELVELTDGQRLLDYMAVTNPMSIALILMDLKMPRVGGLEALEHLKQDGITGTVPTVVMSSSVLESDIRQAYDLGARAFMTKPINHTDFEEAVKGIGVFWCKYNRLPITSS